MFIEQHTCLQSITIQVRDYKLVFYGVLYSFNAFRLFKFGAVLTNIHTYITVYCWPTCRKFPNN